MRTADAIRIKNTQPYCSPKQSNIEAQSIVCQNERAFLSNLR